MKLFVIGMGPGSFAGQTLAAKSAIEHCTVIYGYTAYIALIQKLYPDKTVQATGMRQETERVRLAMSSAQTQDTALVCSGDAQLYGMAGLCYELLAQYPGVEIEVVAGVTAAFSGGAVLGAPLTHDFAVISLSDLLTPWEKIETRLQCAAMADFVIVLYNPSSKHRPQHLQRACDVVLSFRDPETVCGYVRCIGREGEESRLLTLGTLRDTAVDMFTTVYIGNSETRNIAGKMVTPRGYRLCTDS